MHEASLLDGRGICSNLLALASFSATTSSIYHGLVRRLVPLVFTCQALESRSGSSTLLVLGRLPPFPSTCTLSLLVLHGSSKGFDRYSVAWRLLAA